jgi:hypothetical protein
MSVETHKTINILGLNYVHHVFIPFSLFLSASTAATF